jgi:hypothetical protein
MHCSKNEPASSDGSAFPQLQGSWFVRYASDPKPYLDVAFEQKPGGKIKTVKATLQGPSKRYPDIGLQYNSAEKEWQKVCDFLPQPLAGGIWWVSEIMATTQTGAKIHYKAESHHKKYRMTIRNADGAKIRESQTDHEPGAFYSTEAGAPIYTILTRPEKGKPEIDLAMYVYLAPDTDHWIAYNDDPDVKEIYPQISMPLLSGQKYYIRITNKDENGGPYSILFRIDARKLQPKSNATGSSTFASNNSSVLAKKLELNELENHTLTSNEEDWFVLSLPKKSTEQ